VGRKPAKPAVKAEKKIDETCYLTGRRRSAVLKEEVWYRGNVVVRYSLAYINPRICAVDNGRVLGYDNAHGHSHRHFMGKTEALHFPGYEALLTRFQKEVHALWRAEDEE
jgi:hypothetical protein